MARVKRKRTEKSTIKEILSMLEEKLESSSENYPLKQQNEIMTTHWSNKSLTLFCLTVHYKEGGKKKFQHYALVSDNLKHKKDSIWFYNNFIINDDKGNCHGKGGLLLV